MDKWLEHYPRDQDVAGSNPSSYSKRLFFSLSLKALDLFSSLPDETTVTQQQEKIISLSPVSYTHLTLPTSSYV